MTSIAIFNNKGGVGKTTLTCNLATYFSKMGHKVLVIDADPQCNSSSYCIDDDDLERIYTGESRVQTLWDIVESIADGEGFAKEIRYEKIDHFGFDLIPGSPNLSTFEDILAQDWNSVSGENGRSIRSTLVFYDILNRSRNYDYIFFDMGPSLGAINRAILIACDYFMTPLSSDIFSLMAISNIGKSIKMWNKKFLTGYQQADVKVKNQFGEIKPIKYLGYVVQQYTSKTIAGEKRPVKAYENILEKVPSRIESDLAHVINGEAEIEYNLGSIPNFNSIIPLSQSAHKPVIRLKSADGVVGAHFSKIKEFEDVLDQITRNVLKNVNILEGKDDGLA